MTYSGRVDIQQVIDESPFSGFHWLLIVLGFLVLAIDGFDTAAMGYIAPTLSTEWGIHKQDLGPVLSAALLGLSLGALIAGPVSDRMGRKRVLVFSCLFFGLASLGTAWAQSLNTLTLWRFLTGLGLGAAMPNAITLISEFAPQRCRAMAINTMYCGFPLGAAGGGAISSWLIPHHGWRSVLLTGAIAPLILTVLLALLLPESVKFLVQRGKDVAQVRRIASRFARSTLDSVTGFFLTEEKVASKKRQRVAAVFHALAARHPDAVGHLLYGTGDLLRPAELDADADAGDGVCAGGIRLAHLAVHLRRHRWHFARGLDDGSLGSAQGGRVWFRADDGPDSFTRH